MLQHSRQTKCVKEPTDINALCDEYLRLSYHGLRAKGNIDEVKAIASDVIDNEEKINHHGKRADAIVKGMLQHSRKNTGKKETNRH